MTLLPDGSVPHALVDDVDAPSLDDAADHHLRRVRRLRPGAALTVTDGAGRWRQVTLGSVPGAVEAVAEAVEVAAPERRLTVAFALTKGSKPDLVVQKLTELGIDTIVPFVAERSVVRWTPDKISAAHERWMSIARGAVEQSRRVWVPLVEPLAVFDDVVGRIGATLLDRDGDALGPDDSVLAVGPEGGWSSAERATAARRVSIGENVLRAETAAIAVGAVLTQRRSAER